MKKRHAYQNPIALSPFAAAYIAAALQLSDEEIGDDWTIHNLTPSTRAGMVYECEKFQKENAALLVEGYRHATEFSEKAELRQFLWQGSSEEYDAQAGTDFWLTRNGHGTGFWDRPEVYGEESAEQLSKAAEQFGECDLYEGGDKHVYQSPQVLTNCTCHWKAGHDNRCPAYAAYVAKI